MARVRIGVRVSRSVLAIGLILPAACKSVPAPVVTTPVAPAVVASERKHGWIIRLEQQRALRDAGVPGVRRDEAAPRALAPAATADLEALALDPDPTLRRKALLAIGRVGAFEGLPALLDGLRDTEADVRAAAAFGIGLVGPDARGSLPKIEAALADSSLVVRARAIEALGLVGDAAAAPAVVRAAAGCGPILAPIGSDDEALPKSPEIEVCRLALLALVRLRDYDRLAEVALDAQGRPVSRWWPVAYALQRINDRRAGPALLSLTTGSGINTVGFALRGLAALRDPSVVTVAGTLAANRETDIKVRIAAVRALAQAGGPQATPALVEILNGIAVPFNLAIETVTALGVTGGPAAFDPLIDRLNDPSPAMRAAALASAAKVDPDAFLLILAGLGEDRDWTVRAALAPILATLPPQRVTAAARALADDEDARVHGPALEALVALKAPDVTDRLFASLAVPDFAERSTAARLVGETRPAGGITRLVTAYARGESDATYTARASALEALSKYGTDEAKAAIRRGLSDRDWPVRWRAATLLREMGENTAVPERPAPIRQPAAFFESAALVSPPFSPHAFIETAVGRIELELNVVDAPMTSQNFIELSRNGFFNGMKVHRLIPTFVIQAGDPRGDGEGGPGYSIPDELSPTPYVRGTLGMALEFHDTGGSQWFITLSPQPHLDAKYAVFGKVVDGWEVLDRLSQWDVIDRIRIWDGVEFR